LVEVLTDEEYQEARKSVLNAFFTPKPIVDNVFKKANLLVADRLDDDAFSHLNTDVVMFQRLTVEEEEKRATLIEYFPALSEGNVPNEFIDNDDVNWIKSYSPNEYLVESAEERIAPINFGFYNSNSTLLLKNGVLAGAINRFGKPIIKMFSYDNYKKLGLKGDKDVGEIELENYHNKKDYRGRTRNINAGIDFDSFKKNLSVLVFLTIKTFKEPLWKTHLFIVFFH
jgi:hypothetical protein